MHSSVSNPFSCYEKAQISNNLFLRMLVDIHVAHFRWIVSCFEAANIDWYVVSERCYFFLQLQIGPTDLFMVVPRNYAIFPKLHTNRY